jgi:hypothetical protein
MTELGKQPVGDGVPMKPGFVRSQAAQAGPSPPTAWGHTLTATGQTVWAELAPGTLSVPSPP